MVRERSWIARTMQMLGSTSHAPLDNDLAAGSTYTEGVSGRDGGPRPNFLRVSGSGHGNVLAAGGELTLTA